jgi:hypothetical protein
LFQKRGRAFFFAILRSAVLLEKAILAGVLEPERAALDQLKYLYGRFYQGAMEHPDLAILTILQVSDVMRCSHSLR